MDVEPVVHRAVDRVELIADFPRGHVVGLRARLGRRPVLVGSADVQRVQPALAAVPREDVRAEHAANQIAQVRNIVHVGQCRRDQNVLLSRYRKNLARIVDPLPLLRRHRRGRRGELLLVRFGRRRFGRSGSRGFGGRFGAGLLGDQNARADEGGGVFGGVAGENGEGGAGGERKSDRGFTCA